MVGLCFCLRASDAVRIFGVHLFGVGGLHQVGSFIRPIVFTNNLANFTVLCCNYIDSVAILIILLSTRVRLWLIIGISRSSFFITSSIMTKCRRWCQGIIIVCWFNLESFWSHFKSFVIGKNDCRSANYSKQASRRVRWKSWNSYLIRI